MDCGIFESTDTSYPPDTSSHDTGDFECNICFELAQEPIITLCGHLYCWPCLYQWLRLHSHSHECPLCKSIVHEEKLIPIYGRGKTNREPRSRPIPIPNRPMGQRPQPAPQVIDTSFIVRPNHEMDPLIGFMPMAAARFGHMTLSAIFGALPSIFNFQAFNDGVPYLFSSSLHGGYYGHYGFHDRYHSAYLAEWKSIVWRISFVILVCLVLLYLIVV